VRGAAMRCKSRAAECKPSSQREFDPRDIYALYMALYVPCRSARSRAYCKMLIQQPPICRVVGMPTARLYRDASGVTQAADDREPHAISRHASFISSMLLRRQRLSSLKIHAAAAVYLPPTPRRLCHRG